MRALLLQVRTQYANLVRSQSLRLYSSTLAVCVYLVRQLRAHICAYSISWYGYLTAPCAYRVRQSSALEVGNMVYLCQYVMPCCMCVPGTAIGARKVSG
jgi:hypothetical protein